MLEAINLALLGLHMLMGVIGLAKEHPKTPPPPCEQCATESASDRQ